jgi:hypothetical protein
MLMQKFGSQLKVEHNSRKNCEKSLVIFKVFVSITFHVHFFSSFSPQFSCQVVDDTTSMNFCKVFAQTLTNECKKQEFFFKSSNFENSLLPNLIIFPFLITFFSPELLSLTVSDKI